jgi:hypothetical protein
MASPAEKVHFLMLSISIDWLALNFKEHTHEAERFMSMYARVNGTQECTPRFGYGKAHMDGNGTVTMWNVDRGDMGYHVIFAGTALRNLFQSEQTVPQSLLRAVVDAGGRISRLDLAKDLTGQEVDLQAIYQQIEQGNYTGTARKYGRITSDGNGETIYIGSRTSERFIRIYNKSAEQELNNQHWFRFELETKGEVARAITHLCLGTDHWEAVFDNVVRGMVWMERPKSWRSFFDNGGIKIGLPKIEKQTDREAWIETQVTPAVLKHFAENKSSVAVLRLIDALLFLLNKPDDSKLG